MSTLAGTDTYQKQVSPIHAALPDGQITRGDRAEFFATYVCTGSEVTADVIPVINLPVGAVLRPGSIRVSSDGTGGTSVSISKLGDAGVDNRYSSTAITGLSSAATELAVTPTNAIAVTPFVIDTAANATLLATITHSGAPTANKKIVFRGEYRMP